jgi:hypothetical protein
MTTAARAVAADRYLGDFDAEAAVRAELEALGEDVCSSGDEARESSSDEGETNRTYHTTNDFDPVDAVRRAWRRREAHLELRAREAAEADFDGFHEDVAEAEDVPEPGSFTRTKEDLERSSPRAPGPEREVRRGDRIGFLLARGEANDSEKNDSDARRAFVAEDAAAAQPVATATATATASRPASSLDPVSGRRPHSPRDDAYSSRRRSVSKNDASRLFSAAARVQARWRGGLVRERLRRAFETARLAAEDDDDAFEGVDEAFYAPPAYLDLEEEDPETSSSPHPRETTHPESNERVVSGFSVSGSGAAAAAEDGAAAGALARKLEAAAAEWGFSARSPAEEAFLKHRAKVHVEARRRARRERLKDPMKRVERFLVVAAAKPAGKKENER